MSFFSHPPGIAVAIRFLKDYAEFGCTSHLATSNALKLAFTATNDIDQKKLIAVKNFAEMMNIIEDVAGLCISIKHRDEGVGLVFGFLTYNTNETGAPSTSVRQFYEAIQNNDYPIEVLKLPTLLELTKGNLLLDQDLLDRVRGELTSRGLLDANSQLTTGDLLERLYNELPRVLKSAAKTYFAEDKILVRAYNQTKHGFKVIKNPSVFAIGIPPTDEQCIIFVKNPAYTSGDKNSGKVLEFSQLDYRDFDKVTSNISIFTGALKMICILVTALLETRMITSADDLA